MNRRQTLGALFFLRNKYLVEIQRIQWELLACRGKLKAVDFVADSLKKKK